MKKLTVDEIKKIYNENSFVKCRKYYDIEFWCIIPLVIIKDGIKIQREIYIFGKI